MCFFQAEDGIRYIGVTGVQTCALPICNSGLGPGAVTPVCGVAANLLGIVVRADSPWRDGRDIVAAARGRALHFGSTGRVSLSALAVHRMHAAAGGQYGSVPFRSDGPSLTELLVGRLDFSPISIANATPQIRDGALRLVGVSADRRYPAFPEVPTFPEQG